MNPKGIPRLKAWEEVKNIHGDWESVPKNEQTGRERIRSAALTWIEPTWRDPEGREYEPDSFIFTLIESLLTPTERDRVFPADGDWPTSVYELLLHVADEIDSRVPDNRTLGAQRRWPSTVESARQVPYWRDLEEDEEVQAALREVGLAPLLSTSVEPGISGGGDYKLIERARLDAVMRMLVGSGDMTPTAVRQISLSLGLESAAVEVPPCSCQHPERPGIAHRCHECLPIGRVSRDG